MSTVAHLLDAESATIEDLEQDPYPFFAHWREHAPVAYVPAVEGWMVSRWDDCEYIGKLEGATNSESLYSDSFFGRNILTMGGDPHARLRSAVDVPLRPKAVAKYVDALTRPVAREYVQRVREMGRFDASKDLLERISVRVVANVLGLSDFDDDTLQRWFNDLNQGLNNFAGDPEVDSRANTAKREIHEYSESVYPKLTADPDESILSALFTGNTEDEGPRPLDEIIGTAWVIVLGGFQEPGHAAAASLLGLLTEPEQYAAVVADPSLVPAAVHEGLRWIAPFGTVQRKALVDIEVDGITIPAGDEIQLAVASANRDERRYEDPERFDVFRPRQAQASFGYGEHFCAGHFLGREVERVALEEIVAGLPDLRLDPDRPVVEHGLFVRGVKNLPVMLGEQ
ncbi:cytochrome P450 [Leucobacter soli]|uniref:Aromatic O-demethylase, cytochrome P450 subunit n=1 Tax=Leucobacter soli TaxID=2812850 RepID=A0A916JXK8_9MICO|nr:cytochrome P450 [Leucobacter soli]CAG7610396.1 Aromatic O-demethylase, cytochrome P450 subunit [Leucobacter soli]